MLLGLIKPKIIILGLFLIVINVFLRIIFCIINYFELIPLSKYLNVSLIGLRLYIAKSALIIFPFLIFSYIKFESIQKAYL